jgi:hypothetical protein
MKLLLQNITSVFLNNVFATPTTTPTPQIRENHARAHLA